MCKIKRDRIRRKAVRKEYCHLGERGKECKFTETCSYVRGSSAVYKYQKCGASNYEKGFNDGWNALVDHIKVLPWDKAVNELGIIIGERIDQQQSKS